jgi:hypothetical protein
MSRRMMVVVALSAVSGLLVAMMLGEEAPGPRTAPVANAPPLDASNAMADALRKAIEGDKR